MTKTLTTSLREACRPRGLEFFVYPDQPIYGPRPFSKYWGCAYGSDDGELAAFVKAPGRRSAKKALLAAVEADKPPVVNVVREGTVVQWVDGGWLIVRYDDGDLDRLGLPHIGGGRQPGNRVEVVALEGEPDPVLRWGPKREPSRLAEASVPHPTGWLDSEPTVLAEDDTGPRPWVLEAFPAPSERSTGRITIRQTNVELPELEPPVRGRVGAGVAAWAFPSRRPLIQHDWLWDPRWETREPVLFGTVARDATAVEYKPEAGEHLTTTVLDTPEDWPGYAFIFLPGAPPSSMLVAKDGDRVIAQATAQTERRRTPLWAWVTKSEEVGVGRGCQ